MVLNATRNVETKAGAYTVHATYTPVDETTYEVIVQKVVHDQSRTTMGGDGIDLGSLTGPKEVVDGFLQEICSSFAVLFLDEFREEIDRMYY